MENLTDIVAKITSNFIMAMYDLLGATSAHIIRRLEITKKMHRFEPIRIQFNISTELLVSLS